MKTIDYSFLLGLPTPPTLDLNGDILCEFDLTYFLSYLTPLFHYYKYLITIFSFGIVLPLKLT